MADSSPYLEICCGCGVQFWMTTDLNRSRREDNRSFYCPNGHAQSYRENKLEILQKEKDELQRRLQAEINTAKHLAAVRLKALEAEKRERRKIERRVANGVCPCCNRTFEDLQRHMKTKHKDYALPSGPPKEIEAPKAVQ